VLLLGIVATGLLNRKVHAPVVTAEFTHKDTVVKQIDITRIAVRAGKAIAPPALSVPSTVDSNIVVAAEAVRDSIAHDLDSLGVEKIVRLDTIVNSDTVMLSYSEYTGLLSFDLRFAPREIETTNTFKTITIVVPEVKSFYEEPLFLVPVCLAVGLLGGVIIAK
jgi:hypothetical protein